MKFQDRDGELLWFVYNLGGVVAITHLWRVFWPQKSLRAVQRRVQKLCGSGYLARPALQDYRNHPIPQPVVWLGWKGACHIAGQCGVATSPLQEPVTTFRMKKMARELLSHHIRWLWQPRWSKVAHDLRIVDFRLAIEGALAEMPNHDLEEWMAETDFRTDMDVVTYQLGGRDGAGKESRRGVIPDACFAIVDKQRRARNMQAVARHLLEIDMASHSNPAFGKDKVRPYAAYFKSPAYQARFGSDAGRWLVVTTGWKRLENLKKQTKQNAGEGAGRFYFATFEECDSANMLTAPIWWQVDSSEPVPLFQVQDSDNQPAAEIRHAHQPYMGVSPAMREP